MNKDKQNIDNEKSVSEKLTKYREEIIDDIDDKMSFLEEVLGRKVSIHHQERIKIVALEIMHGLSPQQIVLKYHEEWGVKKSTINTQLMNDARKFINSQILTDDNDIRLDLVGKYYYLYQRFIEDSNLPEARKTLDSLSNLIKKIENKVNIIGDISTIVLEEVKHGE